MTPEVQEAIEEIRTAFPGYLIEVTPEAQGGAYVVVNDLPVGEQYIPAQTWVGFLIGFLYPQADVYPHFTAPDLHRKNEAPLGEGMTGPIDWNGRRAIQISRRSNRWNPATDTAALKLAKVLEWIRSK